MTDGEIRPGYAPYTVQVRIGAQDVFVGKDLIADLKPGGVRLNTDKLRTEPFQRRAGEVPRS